MKIKLPLLLVTLGLAAWSAGAQVPGIISHQGKVTDNGTNYTGSGQFKFALVDATGATTYWSHDGSSSKGAEPASAITLPVTRGVFSVNLGDSNVANMTLPIPTSVFTNPEVYLRTWFNDGINGSQLLSPDRRIASVGYAMNAGSYAETDPVFAASAAYGIQAGDITNWNGKVAAVTVTSPLATTGGATPTLSIQPATGAQPGYLANADWNTFNNKTPTNRVINTTAPLIGGNSLASDLTVSMPAATTSANGYLASADWNTFNNKTPTNRVINTTAPLIGGSSLAGDLTVSLPPATTSANGYLTSTDWTTFNNKIGGIGTAGYVATFSGTNTMTNNAAIYSAAAGNVGIGTNAPNASAKLDVSSTTQGFLPPRMTRAQENAIVNPTPGLLVYCTDAGPSDNPGQLHIYQYTNWYNLGPIPAVLHIGDSYGGGRVGYLLQPGDAGYDINNQHGIIVASADSVNSASWCPTPQNTGGNGQPVYTALGATNNAFFTAPTNTILMNRYTAAQIAAGAPSFQSYASVLATNYSSGNFHDWVLPNASEMYAVMTNYATLGISSGVVYWTSQEATTTSSTTPPYPPNTPPDNSTYAYGIWADTTAQHTVSVLLIQKNNSQANNAPIYVRPIRYF